MKKRRRKLSPFRGFTSFNGSFLCYLVPFRCRSFPFVCSFYSFNGALLILFVPRVFLQRDCNHRAIVLFSVVFLSSFFFFYVNINSILFYTIQRHNVPRARWSLSRFIMSDNNIIALRIGHRFRVTKHVNSSCWSFHSRRNGFSCNFLFNRLRINTYELKLAQYIELKRKVHIVSARLINMR